MDSEEMARLHAAAKIAPRPWTAGEFDALLAQPGSFLAGDGRSFALGRVILDEAELLTLVTAPDLRRRGLARATLAAFHAGAARRGAVTAFLEVAADNIPARTLYSRAGYSQSGLRKRYYRSPEGPAVDAVLMMRPLDLP